MVPWWRVGWWRGGSLVASWLVARFPGGEMTGYRLNYHRESFRKLKLSMKIRTKIVFDAKDLAF